MTKVLGWVIGIIIFIIVVLFGISIYLRPNSLAKCSDKPSDIELCEKADVIVTVSGGNTDKRTEHAIDLYKNGWADKLIFSGADSDPNRPSNAANMRDQAIDAGVPKSAILIEETSRDTHENAVNVNKILEEIDAKNVLLVSSPYHMRRVEIEFSDATTDIGFRTSPVKSDSVWDNWWFSPRGLWLTFHELGGIVVHYISGAGQ